MADHSVSLDALLTYAIGHAEPAEAARIGGHVAMCAACAETVAKVGLIRATVRGDAELAPTPAVVERVKALGRRAAPRTAPWSAPAAAVKRFVASLSFDGRLSPGLAGVRGEGDGFVLAYAHEALDVDLQLEPAGANGDLRRVTGQVALHDGGRPVGIALAEPGSLEPLATATADADGLFELELTAGTYDLLVQLDDAVVVVPNVELE